MCLPPVAMTRNQNKNCNNKKTLSRKTATIFETVNLYLIFVLDFEETCDDQVTDLEMMKI